ncbi:extracellular solute-binding protein [Caldilinea sp.]|uniref:extracellular solute-binding protein n=1 Tax=Caldilinea sp. TaxID=2293560 RepID=UPI0021DE6329|nr:extracellular solute-binding protein [Caldilinea sp.]GIV69259.1 MAG: ABC transporter substrate-binding protein [Caldilinea sp.]
MNRRMIQVIGVMMAALLLLAACAPVAAPPSALQTAPPSEGEDLESLARAEGGVINTYGMPEVWANYGEIFGEFQRRYGIVQQDIDMGSSVVLSRMTEENASKNDIADLKPSFAAKLAEAGLTMDYKVSCWDELPEGQKGISENGSVWQAAYKGTLGWIVNTNIVKEPPRSWKELNNPAFKGLVSYLDPRATGTGVNTVEAVSYAVSGDPYNYKAGSEFLAELHKAGIIASVDPKVDVSKFQRGEVAILINFDYNLLQWKKDLGVPAEVIIPLDGTIASGGGVIAARNAPHPNTAKLFLEFLLCGDGQRLYAKAYVSPINPSVEIPEEVAAEFPPKEQYANVSFIDYARDAEISEDLKATWAALTGASE